MAQALVSEKYLIDIANAIRVKLGSEANYTPAQMATAIATIDGTISGSITPSTATGKGIITDSNLTAIANAIRAKLDVETLYTPAQMADAILSIPSAAPTIVSWASGSDAEVVAMIEAARLGVIDLQQDGGWSIGDRRTIQISAFQGGVYHEQQNVTIDISSFDDYNNCGCVLQFDFSSCLAEKEAYGAGTTYVNSIINATVLPALSLALPNWLSTLLLPFDVVASNYTTIQTIQGVKLALRSSIEIANDNYTAAGQGTYMDYYKNNASNKGKGMTWGDYYWTRSEPNDSGWSSYVHVISSSGTRNNQTKASSWCVAPFGCL